jgi:hypothetical protein
MKRLLIYTYFAMSLVSATAAAQTLDRRADIRGGSSGGGKCTFEIEVDGSAEVQFSGNVGRLRTISGQPAIWRRLECTEPLPRNPVDFRFRGIDGRGRVALIRDPRGGRDWAVVRIDDPDGGREGYTFDLEWRGSGGSSYGRPSPWPGWQSGGRNKAAYAMNACRDAVRDRIAGSRYGDIDFRNVRVNDGPGRDESITGEAFTRRGQFRFACRVDFDSGRLRDVDIDRF